MTALQGLKVPPTDPCSNPSCSKPATPGHIRNTAQGAVKFCDVCETAAIITAGQMPDGVKYYPMKE